jgi:dipeptidase D
MKTISDILAIFERLAAIPRASRNEAAVAAWLLDWGRVKGWEALQDATGNVLLRVPAWPGAESAPVVILQGHMDMVCEKRPESGHDFSHDPIVPVQDGEWLRASGPTSLGADNGIAIALALSAADDPDVQHPPLELLFTVDEEAGMSGALGLKPDFVQGRVLLNIDSEEEGVLIVGCSGGQGVVIRLPFTPEPTPAGWQTARLEIGGARGGHSGVDIHLGRANANVLVGRALNALRAALPEGGLRLADIQGGTAMNAICRAASATIVMPVESLAAGQAVISRVEGKLRAEYPAESELSVHLTANRSAGETASAEISARMIDLLLAAPHGVEAMSQEFPGLVQTSANLARVNRTENAFEMAFSVRGMALTSMIALSERIAAVGRLVGAQVDVSEAGPPWQPDLASPLLARCRSVYEATFGRAARVAGIHGGLETRVLTETYPGMQAISFGPTIQSPHSPSERLHVGSVGQIYTYMAALLKSFV